MGVTILFLRRCLQQVESWGELGVLNQPDVVTTVSLHGVRILPPLFGISPGQNSTCCSSSFSIDFFVLISFLGLIAYAFLLWDFFLISNAIWLSLFLQMKLIFFIIFCNNQVFGIGQHGNIASYVESTNSFKSFNIPVRFRILNKTKQTKNTIKWLSWKDISGKWKNQNLILNMTRFYLQNNTKDLPY